MISRSKFGNRFQNQQAFSSYWSSLADLRRAMGEARRDLFG
jgi:hypothetical protein